MMIIRMRLTSVHRNRNKVNILIGQQVRLISSCFLIGWKDDPLSLVRLHVVVSLRSHSALCCDVITTNMCGATCGLPTCDVRRCLPGGFTFRFLQNHKQAVCGRIAEAGV